MTYWRFAIVFFSGMAALPLANLLVEIVRSLTEHWVHLDHYDTVARSRSTPLIGRAIHRVMRMFKPRSP